MPTSLGSPEQILTALAAAPPRLAALTEGLTPAQLKATPGPGEWSANEALAHLRACADMWGECIVAMLSQDRPTLKAVNPRAWIGQTDYLEQEFAPSLHAFTTQRADLLAVLTPLPHEDWSRSATVMVAGKPLERTVFFYAHWLASHERPHLKQIERVVQTMRL